MPLFSVSEAADWRDQLDSEGRRVVFTSGCFDILHAGHVRYLAQAREKGDALIIALNSDASVREIKGPARPVNPQEDRAEVLLALESVDAVVIFDAPRTTRLIQIIRPHLFAKGGDYTLDTLDPGERAALEALGARIHLLPEVKGRSTTATLARLAVPENQPSFDTLDARVPAIPVHPAAPASAAGTIPPPSAHVAPVAAPAAGSGLGGGLPRLGILGSGEGSNFGVLLEAIAGGRLQAEVALVLSDNPQARILTRAREHGIEAAWIDPGSHPNRFSAEAQEAVSQRFRDAGCDLIICAGFMRRLKDPVLTDFAGRIVNIHPSLLPAFPGREAWKQAFDAGVSETGCTVHLIDAGIDTGPILAQAAVPVLPTDSVEDVRHRIQAAEHILFPKAIQALLGRLSRIK